MGALARYLATHFERHPPYAWKATREARLLDGPIARRLAFDPRVDVLLVGPRGRKVAVEFEVSRADPVANQVKFLLARDQGALQPDDLIVSMVSSHVAPGRRAIAAAFTRHMRTQGIAAFQVSLLPFQDPGAVHRLNPLAPAEFEARGLPLDDEVARVGELLEARGEAGEHRIHFAGDVTDVLANLWAFNDSFAGGAHAGWRKRPVQYFVCDPGSGLFAPSKFCAFVPAPGRDGAASPPTMTLAVYASLGERDPRFDGHVARRHLARRLAFEHLALDGSSHVEAFSRWHATHVEGISLRSPVTLLVPPRWHWNRHEL